MNVYNDFKKIIDQMLGRCNIFGYQTTLANQAYLLYSFFGKIYTTDHIHRHTKLLFFLAFIIIIIMEIIEIVFFFEFYIHDDLLTQMYTLFVLFCPGLTFSVALMTHANRHLIESTIAMIDKFVAENSVDSYISGKRIDTKMILYVPILYLSSLAPFYLCCVADVAIFYDESKVRSNIYYLIPLPKVEQYGFLEFYVVFNIICSVLSSTVVFTFEAVMILPLLWAVVCYNEVQRIVHDLSSLNGEDHVTAEFNVSFERKFKGTIIRCVHTYRDVIKAVEHFRGYYETIANILLPVMLFMGVTHAYILLTTNTYSYIVMLKELSVFFASMLVIFTYCWVGETLDEMTNTMSLAVYSTPWYLSTRVRKDAYIFLCQTQKSINPAAWSVYPLSLATFLRFMNVVQSSVNILRAVSTK